MLAVLVCGGGCLVFSCTGHALLTLSMFGRVLVSVCACVCVCVCHALGIAVSGGSLLAPSKGRAYECFDRSRGGNRGST
jgi:hypothetical protein